MLCLSQPWFAVVRAWKKYWIGNWYYSSTVTLFLIEAVLKGSQPPEECWVQQSKVDFKGNNCLLSSLSATCVHLIKKSPFSLAGAIAACDAFVVHWPLLTFSFCWKVVIKRWLTLLIVFNFNFKLVFSTWNQLGHKRSTTGDYHFWAHQPLIKPGLNSLIDKAVHFKRHLPVSRSSHTAKYFTALLLPSGALHL